MTHMLLTFSTICQTTNSFNDVVLTNSTRQVFIFENIYFHIFIGLFNTTPLIFLKNSPNSALELNETPRIEFKSYQNKSMKMPSQENTLEVWEHFPVKRLDLRSQIGEMWTSVVVLPCYLLLLLSRCIYWTFCSVG